MRGRLSFVESLESVPYDELYAAGVRRLIFDYDGTLARRQSVMPEQEVLSLLDELSERFEVLVFSNNWLRASQRRVFFATRGIEYVRTQKPLFFEEKYFSSEKPTALIGDKLLTDGLYAKLLGLPCFLLRKWWVFW